MECYPRPGVGLEVSLASPEAEHYDPEADTSNLEQVVGVRCLL